MDILHPESRCLTVASRDREPSGPGGGGPGWGQQRAVLLPGGPDSASLRRRCYRNLDPLVCKSGPAPPGVCFMTRAQQCLISHVGQYPPPVPLRMAGFRNPHPESPFSTDLQVAKQQRRGQRGEVPLTAGVLPRNGRPAPAADPRSRRPRFRCGLWEQGPAQYQRCSAHSR